MVSRRFHSFTVMEMVSVERPRGGENSEASTSSFKWKSAFTCICRQVLLYRTQIYLVFAYIIFCLFLMGIYFSSYILNGVIVFKPLSNGDELDPSPNAFVVYTNQCKMEDLDPYRKEVMQHFSVTKLKSCRPHPPLTQVKYDPRSQRYVLGIDPKAFPSYNVHGILKCCYESVLRVHENAVNYTKCKPFTTSTQLANDVDSVIVNCAMDDNTIYLNGHATIPERPETRQRLDHWAVRDKVGQVPSVLMIGIDSISRVNLKRAMPTTAEYLNTHGWFELAGYNKIDDNTFPNIMALMVGYNLSSAVKYCDPYKKNGLDPCAFLWNMFRQHGYVTAYGEDAVKISTFNYLKKGFQEIPVDHYLRPYLFAAEKRLEVDTKHGMPHCVGYETEAISVYKYALEFARRYRNDSYFGFFWTNTHSHSDISQTSSMDAYLKAYLQRLVAQGTMEHSVVVFFSDHGLRFGPTRSTWSGYLEERLPFLFIWLPKFLKREHPEFVDALRLNRHRLTTPYDLHMTLKHILSLSGRAGSLESLGGAKDCPQCQSLLLPVPLERSCGEVAIADHWCACRVFKRASGDILQLLGLRIVDNINWIVMTSKGEKCEPLTLNEVRKAYVAYDTEFDSDEVQIYLLTISTDPNNALYEATLRYDKRLPENDQITVSSSPSRVNSYGDSVPCVEGGALLKYCQCREPKE